MLNSISIEQLFQETEVWSFFILMQESTFPGRAMNLCPSDYELVAYRTKLLNIKFEISLVVSTKYHGSIVD